MQTVKRNSFSLKLTVILLVFIFTMGTAVLSSQAMAIGNYQDTTFNKTSDGSGGDYVTPPREKWDYTSSWAKNNSASSVRLANVMSVASYGGSQFYLGHSIDIVTLDKGQGKYLQQLIKEHGFTYACIVMTPPRYTTFSVDWSPDSV